MKKKLVDVCRKITDGSHNPPEGISHSKYLMISSKNIEDDNINFDEPRYLSKDDFINENKRTNIESGDILMTIVGTIGRVAIVSESIAPFCVQRSVAVVKPDLNCINARYLMYQLQNMRPLLEGQSRGVAQKGIYLKQVEALLVMVPKLVEQDKVVEVLEKISELIIVRKKQVDLIEKLVKSRCCEQNSVLRTEVVA